MITRIQGSLGNTRFQTRNNPTQSSNYMTKANNMSDTVSFGALKVVSGNEVFAMTSETKILFEQVKSILDAKKKLVYDKLPVLASGKLPALFPEGIALFRECIKKYEKEFGISIKTTNRPLDKVSYGFSLKSKTQVNGFNIIFEDSPPQILHGHRYYYPHNSINLISNQKNQTVIYPSMDELGNKIFVLGEKIGEDDKAINENLQRYFKTLVSEEKSAK